MQKWFQKFFTTSGVILVILAALILIDALNILPAPWGNHLGLSFFFLVILIICLRWKFTFLSTLFVSFIVMLHKSGLGMAHVSNWTILGIAILAGIGLSLLYHPHVKYVKRLIQGEEPAPFATIEDKDDENTINLYSRFSDTSRQITGEFSKININTRISDVALHLDNAILPTPTATINFDCKSSNLNLYIPLEWNIDDQLNKIGSTIDFNGPVAGSGTKTIYLTGDLLTSKLIITRV